MALVEVAYTEQEIATKVKELAASIEADFDGERPVLVSVLKGSVVFLADLVRAMELDSDIDFMSISSYGDDSPVGVVRIVKDLEEPLEGRRVVVVEDIIDTGLTLSYLLRNLEHRGPKSLDVCTLVDKSVRRIADVDIRYVGFTAEQFLVGYGLDFKGRYRNLPYLAAVNDLGSLVAQPDVLLEWVMEQSGSGEEE